jgi:hypothetical protein
MQYKKIERKEILIRQKKAGWKFFHWFISLLMNLAQNWHTSSMKLKLKLNFLATKFFSCQKIITSHAIVVETLKILHHKLLAKAIKNLKIHYIFHLILYPILDGIPKRKSIQIVMFLCKHLHNKIQMCN